MTHTCNQCGTKDGAFLLNAKGPPLCYPCWKQQGNTTFNPHLKREGDELNYVHLGRKREVCHANDLA